MKKYDLVTAALNGRKYYGWVEEVNGDYVRVKIAKVNGSESIDFHIDELKWIK